MRGLDHIMSTVIPYYFAVLDGEDPQNWTPFQRRLAEVLPRDRFATAPSTYSTTKSFSLAVLCQKHETVAKEAMAQIVGCFVDSEYLTEEREAYFFARFEDFTGRLNDFDRAVIEALGFEIFVVSKSGLSKEKIKRAMKLKERLRLCGFAERLIRVDRVTNEERLIEILESRLEDISTSVSALQLKPMS
jgi:hypothetical protein